MKKHVYFLGLLFFAMMSGCDSSDAEIDMQKPVIDLAMSNNLPQICDTVYFGESLKVRFLLKDNASLGSYSIDIHHNFDHHTHSTEVVDCDLGDVKAPSNPFLLIDDFSIPAGSQTYETNLEVSIPASNEQGNFDEGDYHFSLSVTDVEGWSDQVGFGITMMHR